MNRGLVCVVGFNRPHCIVRIINQLDRIDLDALGLDLIVSLDYSDKQNDISAVIERAELNNRVTIVRRKSRLGLKQHILTCGDYALDPNYDFVVVLEDDLLVSPTFTSFLFSALALAKEQYTGVAGISLYSYLYSEETLLPFLRQPDQFDAYYMQFPSSWGQVWTKEMWGSFREWFAENDCEMFDDPLVPSFVNGWPKSSWKKHFVRYLVHTNSYFLYPNYSLTSNPGEDGSNHKSIGGTFSTRLLVEERDWSLPLLGEVASRYNARFEIEAGSCRAVDLSKLEVAERRYSELPIGVKAAFLLFLVSIREKIKPKWLGLGNVRAKFR